MVKQPVNITFAQGIDTKIDPWQIPVGQFLSLNNSVFTTGSRLTKRNGFGPLAALPNETSTYLTTFSNSLVAIGTSLEALSESTNQWFNKGSFRPIDLSTSETVRSPLSQIQCDSVIASNGLVCTVYTENNNGTSLYKYTIQDSTDGNIIVGQTTIPISSGAITGSPRVFLLGGYFIIVFTNTISAVVDLQYIAISISSPTTVVQANTTLASSYTASPGLSWDGIVVGSNLYFAYNTTSGGQAIKVNFLTSGLALGTATTFTGSIATLMSVTADLTTPSPVIYASFWDSAGSTGFAVAVNTTLQKVMTATEWLASGSVANVASTAESGVLTIVYENINNYSYDSSIPSNFISKNTITQPAAVTTGTLGAASVVRRSVGLASKGFLLNSIMYFFAEYLSVFQPTYFLIDINGNIVSRFAYENGGGATVASSGYLTLGLPQAQVIGTTVSVSYLYKDLITSINKTQGVASAAAAGVYSQTGVNLVNLDFSSNALSSAEIGSNLNLSGGYLYAYDGNIITEQGYHVWPDNIELTLNADPAPTGTVSDITNPTIITAVSSVVGIIPGMNISGTGISANTTVVAVGTTTITMSAAATSAHSAETITFTGAMAAQPYFYQVIYQWTDSKGNIFNSAPSIPVAVTTTSGHTTVTVTGPYLRLTSKPNVKIIIYRWSAAQESYYQITSLTNPLLNSTTTDSWSYIDDQSDAQILGNGLIYTTGGVLEDTGGPACTAVTLFDTRLWLIDAEDQNLLWYSKQIIKGTPVEMSDLLTFYVAPNAGTTASTGPMRCLAPLDDKLIIFKKDAMYYVNGAGPDNTGANGQYSQPIFITSTVGSVNQNSIVFMPMGLMFQSDKGIWLLGRDLNTTYIGAPVEAFNGYTVTSAIAIPGTTQVRFTLDNEMTLMYDYFYQQWGTFINTNAVSSTLYQGFHTYISSFGGVFQETPGVYLDPSGPVLMSFTTGWFNLAGLQGYQRAYALYLLGQYITPHKLQVGLAYNYNPSISQLTTITPNNFSSNTPSPFGVPSAPFGANDAVESWRVFFAKQRCSAVQVSVNEIYDPSHGLPAGAGLTLSGLNMLVGIKRGWRTISSTNTAGGGNNEG